MKKEIKTRKEMNQKSLDKLPPQAIEMEEAVLGAVMLVKTSMEEVINLLPDDAFYRPIHSVIYKACKKLYHELKPVDILTVTQELKRTGELDIVGGPFYITSLTNRVASSENIKHHASVILYQYAKREVIRICGQRTGEAFEDLTDTVELIDNLDQDICSLKDAVMGKQDITEWSDQLNQVVGKIEELYRSPIKVSGVPTGNTKLDSITGGWQRTDLIFLCGRPGSGKTTRDLNFVKHACANGMKVAMFSLEMGWEQITRKFLNQESEVYVNKMSTGDINNLQLEKIKEAKIKLSQMNLYLNDKPSINTSYLRTILRQRKKKFGLDLVVVDYAQLMAPIEKLKGRTRDSELGTISAGLKSLAKEFNIPVIALSQLSRKCEERMDKRPLLSDLRESGNLEQDADIVIGIYRPSYYYSFDKDPDYKDCFPTGLMTEEEYGHLSELIILKHRNGQSDVVIKENFYGEFSRFTEQEEQQPKQQIEISRITPQNEDEQIRADF